MLGKNTEHIQAGTLIDYRLRLRGIPIRWQSRIDRWEPNQAFVDVQVRGPYRYWHHTHEFERLGKGTLMRDIVKYAIPGGPFAVLLRPFVARDLRAIFGFRRRVIAERFNQPR